MAACNYQANAILTIPKAFCSKNMGADHRQHGFIGCAIRVVYDLRPSFSSLVATGSCGIFK